MNVTATIRRGRIAWGHRVLAAFAVVWLTVALQPCAMALEFDDHDCPHCPASEVPPCETAITADCDLDELLNAESRNGQLKFKDSPNELPVAMLPTTAIDVSWSIPRSLPIPDSPVHLKPSGPPRNVLFCVYLK